MEDDADSRETLAMLVELSGHAVSMAEDGFQALELLADLRPCAVVLDLMMPRMNGWELVARLQADPSLRDIPVVVVSGVADLEGEARSRGIWAAYAKPLDPDALLACLADLC